MRKLSPREKDVLRLYGEGNNMKEVANKLAIKYNTVHTYSDRIRLKLKAKNTNEALVIAIKQGII